MNKTLKPLTVAAMACLTLQPPAQAATIDGPPVF